MDDTKPAPPPDVLPKERNKLITKIETDLIDVFETSKVEQQKRLQIKKKLNAYEKAIFEKKHKYIKDVKLDHELKMNRLTELQKELTIAQKSGNTDVIQKLIKCITSLS